MSQTKNKNLKNNKTCHYYPHSKSKHRLNNKQITATVENSNLNLRQSTFPIGLLNPRAPSPLPQLHYSEVGVNTKTKKRPLRSNVSCITCRIRKKKCNGNYPKCNVCMKVNMDCIYERKMSRVIGIQSQTDSTLFQLRHSSTSSSLSSVSTVSNDMVITNIPYSNNIGVIFKALGVRGVNTPQLEYKYNESGSIENVEVIYKLHPTETYVEGIGVINVFRAKISIKVKDGVVIFKDK